MSVIVPEPVGQVGVGYTQHQSVVRKGLTPRGFLDITEFSSCRDIQDHAKWTLPCPARNGLLHTPSLGSNQSTCKVSCLDSKYNPPYCTIFCSKTPQITHFSLPPALLLPASHVRACTCHRSNVHRSNPHISHRNNLYFRGGSPAPSTRPGYPGSY